MTRANADREREEILREMVDEHEYWAKRTSSRWGRFLLWLIRKTT